MNRGHHVFDQGRRRGLGPNLVRFTGAELRLGRQKRYKIASGSAGGQPQGQLRRGAGDLLGNARELRVVSTNAFEYLRPSFRLT